MTNRFLRASKLFVAVVQAEIPEVERYDLFVHGLKSQYFGSAMSDRELRDAYLQWRLAGLAEDNLRKAVPAAVVSLLHSVRLWLLLVLVAIAITAVLFPPFHVLVGGEQLHLGFRSAFDRQLGNIDSSFLALELLAVFAVYFSVDRLLARLG